MATYRELYPDNYDDKTGEFVQSGGASNADKPWNNYDDDDGGTPAGIDGPVAGGSGDTADIDGDAYQRGENDSNSGGGGSNPYSDPDAYGPTYGGGSSSGGGGSGGTPAGIDGPVAGGSGDTADIDGDAYRPGENQSNSGGGGGGGGRPAGIPDGAHVLEDPGAKGGRVQGRRVGNVDRQQRTTRPGAGSTESASPGGGGGSNYFPDRKPKRTDALSGLNEAFGVPDEEELGEGIANWLGVPSSEAELAQEANAAVEKYTGINLKKGFEEGFRKPARATTFKAARDFSEWATENPTRAGIVGAVALAEPTPLGELLLLGGGAAAAAGADTVRRANEIETPDDGNPTFGDSEFRIPEVRGNSETEIFVGDSPTGGSEVTVPEGGGVVIEEEIGRIDASTSAGDVTQPSVPDSPTSPETPTGPTLPAPGERGDSTGDVTNPTERVFPTGEGSVVGRGEGYSTPEVEPGGETVSRNESENGSGWDTGADWGGVGGPTTGTGTGFGPRSPTGNTPDTAPTPDYRSPPGFEAPPWTAPDFGSPPDTATPSGFGEPTRFPEPTETTPGFRWPRSPTRRPNLPGLGGSGSSTRKKKRKSDENLFDSGIWDVDDTDFFSL